jgi:CrcB protein
MQSYLIVFVGAGIGGALRHGVNLTALRLLPASIGISTLIVNVLGSFAMGLIIEWFALKSDAPQAFRLFLTTGMLGGFTTFSAFSLETVLLYERGQLGWALLNVLASVSLSIGALFAGLFVVRQMNG